MTINAAELLKGTTPGPWSNYEGHQLVVCDAMGSSLGEMSSGDPYMSVDEQFANAILVAAAPELAARVVELEKALLNAADTVADILKASRMLRYTAVISSCELAERETRALLAKDSP